MRDHATGFIQLQNAQEGEVIIPPWVVLMNTGTSTDRNEDFLLHYYTTTWTPPATWIPPDPSDPYDVREANDEERKLHTNLPQGLTFGCSNSLYP